MDPAALGGSGTSNCTVVGISLELGGAYSRCRGSHATTLEDAGNAWPEESCIMKRIW